MEYRNINRSGSTNLHQARKKVTGKKLPWIVAGIICATSLIVSASVSIYFVLQNLNSNSIETTTTTTFETTTSTQNPLYFISRDAWGADPPKSNFIPKLNLPLKRIIIGHTGGSFCTTQNDCVSLLKTIQTQDSSLDDIPYNFLIGGDGNLYEGRGFNFTGQHTHNLESTEYNSIGICIAFIGNYQSIAPSEDQINLLKDFIRNFINRDLIVENQIIISQDDLKYSAIKADSLNNAIKNLQNFHQLYKVYRREEWLAKKPRADLNNFGETMNWVLIGHTVTSQCHNLNDCAAAVKAIQSDAFSRNPPLSDTLHNIIIGGDGLVFEGRGWDIIGAHTSGYNDKTIGVGVIGDFSNSPPNQSIINALKHVIDDAMTLGKLTDDYKIFGRSDFGLAGPGEAFMDMIKSFCRYGNRTNPCDQDTTPKLEESTTSIAESSTEIKTTIPYPTIPPYLMVRDVWGANPPRSNSIPMLNLPIKRIIIGHTRGGFCTNQNDCISTVRSFQSQDTSLDDIPYNFLVGGDGNIYEGRGFYYQGQHTKNLDATEYNSIGICIAFIGTYTSIAPNISQIDLLNDFIRIFVEHELIAEDHIIVSQDDLKYFQSKADALNGVIAKVENFRPLYKIYRREEWEAQRQRSDLTPFNRTIAWALIGHAVTPLCNNLAACKSRARSLQSNDFTRGLNDILYNIFFGGDGFAFEGRGWDVFGAHHSGLNDRTIATGVIGNFTITPPNEKILNAILSVLDDAMALGKLTEDYKIFGRSDFGGPGPGDAFMNKIKEWCRYGNRTTTC